MKQQPRYTIGNKVHVHGTPGSGTITLVEEFVNRYVYHIKYVDGNGLSKYKAAQECDIILIDSGEIQP